MSETNQVLVEPKGADCPPRERKRILVVEGGGFTRLVLMVLFRIAGLGVDFASNGTIALTKLRSSPPDDLLVELNRRGLSGLELIRKARRDPQFGNRPIYVFTEADQMKRSARKEIQKSVTKVFDKESMLLENVVKTITVELIGEAVQEQAPASTEDQSSGGLAEIIEGVRAQLEVLSKCSSSGERLTSCAKLRSR